MGFSLEDLSKGIGDVGGIIGKSMDAWREIAGTPSAATPPVAASNQPVSHPEDRFQGTAQVTDYSGVILVVAIVVVAILIGRR